MSETVYIQIDKNVQVNKLDVHLSDIADVFCKDKNIQARINAIKLIKLPDVPKKRVCFSIMYVIKKINEIYPEVEVNNIGESDFIVDYIKEKKKSTFVHKLIIAITTVFVFIGSAYAIMAYNNDVSTNEIFEKFYEMFETPEFMEYKIIEIMYAVGLAVGIIVFYNHFAGKRITADPTPLEVQMDKYNTEINDALINHSSSSKKEKE